MKSAKTLMVVALLAAPLVAASVGLTQERSVDSRELNFREYVALLRSDVKAQRKDIVTQLMQFSDSDAAKFWPIVEQYDGELAKIGEGRVQLMLDYARNYENLTNDQADALMSKAFELEAQRAQLKKQYFDKMKAVVSATQATKFFLIENQMQHIVGLQTSAVLRVAKTVSN
jgi:chaperone required for assembly of F1-ATPase